MRLTLDAAESGHLVIATMHASTPEEAIYRLCNSAAIESQNEIRYQLASTLSWLIVQQLVYLERVGFLVPLLTIVRGTQSVKNVIRENKLNQLYSAIQTGKNEGMFSSERYLIEYLETRQKFTLPTLIFRPSAEKVDELMYRSPLTEDKPAARPLIKSSAGGVNDREQILTIDEDASLQDLINKMEFL